jgi:hypothetical protein
MDTYVKAKVSVQGWERETTNDVMFVVDLDKRSMRASITETAA